MQIKAVVTFLILFDVHMNILSIIKVKIFSCSLHGHIDSPNYVDYKIFIKL